MKNILLIVVCPSVRPSAVVESTWLSVEAVKVRLAEEVRLESSAIKHSIRQIFADKEF